MSMTRIVILSLALSALAGSASAAPPKRPDLADTAQGEYHGGVMSDARGSSEADVDITVTKTAPNTVSVVSSYSRIPSRTFRLTRAMNTIQNVGGDEVFLLDLSKRPPALNLTIDDAAWAGEKTSSLSAAEPPADPVP